MLVTNRLVEILKDISLVGSDYFEVTSDLATKLKSASRAAEYSTQAKAYIEKICDNLLRWVEVCRELDGANNCSNSARTLVKETDDA